MLWLCHWRRISLATGRRSKCAEITVELIGRPSQIGIPCHEELFDTIVFSQVFSNQDLRSVYHLLPLHKIEWKPHYKELIRLGRINCIIGSFFHLASRMHLLSFKEWWTKFSFAFPLLSVILMMWSFSAKYHRSMWHICKSFLSGWGRGNCICTMASANFSMTN